MPSDEAAAISDLAHPMATRRKAAARRLRQLGDNTSGAPILEALLAEEASLRTWEVQYQMVLALAQCRYRPALAHLKTLAIIDTAATMVKVALGDAIIRIGQTHASDPTPIIWCLESGSGAVLEGGLRATSFLQAVYSEAVIDQLIEYANQTNAYDGIRYWFAAAATGWQVQSATQFLQACAAGPREDVADVARSSLLGTYPTMETL